MPFLTSHANQQLCTGLVLDAGDHGKAQLPAERDGRPDNRRVSGIAEQDEHKRPVDLEPVEREFLQIAEAGITGAEVIEHDPDAEFLDLQRRLDADLFEVSTRPKVF